MYIKLNIGITHNQVPCDPEYFYQHLKNRKLEVVKEYNSMVRVVDENGEEWNIFVNQFHTCEL